MKVEKGFFMKIFYTIFSILLSILCFIYLLFYPQKNSIFFHCISAKALAKESTTENENSTLSNSLVLSMDTICHELLHAYETKYYYISSQKNICFQITSKNISKTDISLLNDTGQKLSFNTHLSKNICILTPSANSLQHTKRIFLQLKNQSTGSCTLRILAYQSKIDLKSQPKSNADSANHIKRNYSVKITPKPKKTSPSKNTNPKYKQKTLNSSNHSANQNNQTTSNPTKRTIKKSRKKLSTEKEKFAILYPQFLSMKPNSVKKFPIAEKQISSNWIWLSSNPTIATVTEGAVKAIKEGFTIIYVHEKNHPEHTSSCFVRVIERNQ